MKKNVFVFLLVAIALSGLLLAQDSCSISSVTASSSVSKATTGTSIIISSVSTASSQCTASQIQLISTGSTTGGSLTINDPPSPGYYSNTLISTSGTTKTFTVTAGTEDVYTYYVQDTYSGGSQSSTDTIIEFVSPDTLTVSGTPSSADVNEGSSTTITVDVQNPGSSTVSSSYNVSYDSSKMTITGDDRNGTLSISAGSTSSLSFTVTPTSNGTVTFQLGSNTNAFSSTIGVIPITLTTTGTPSTQSINEGNSFTLSVTVQNTGSSSQTKTYNLSYSPALVSTPTASSGSVTVAAGATSTLSWTLSGVSAGTGNVVFQLASNTSAFTSAVTVTRPSGSSGSGGSSGSSDGGSGTVSITPSPTPTATPPATPSTPAPPEVIPSVPSTPPAPPPAPVLVQATLSAPSQVTLGNTVSLALTSKGAAVANAKIKITTPSSKQVTKTTDENGKASFVADEEGFYDYSVEGYAIGLVSTLSKKEEAPPVTPPTPPAAAVAEITPPSSVTPGELAKVTVKLDGKPAANVQVTVTAPDGGTFKITTDANGIATFTPTQAGSYVFNLGAYPSAAPQTIKAEAAAPAAKADYTWILLVAGAIVVLIIVAGIVLFMLKPKK